MVVATSTATEKASHSNDQGHSYNNSHGHVQVPASGMAMATNRGLIHSHAPAHVRSVAVSPANLMTAKVVSVLKRKFSFILL